MTVVGVFLEARRRGITLAVGSDETKLRYVGAVDDRFREMLSQHKAEILALLLAHDFGRGTLTPLASGGHRWDAGGYSRVDWDRGATEADVADALEFIAATTGRPRRA